MFRSWLSRSAAGIALAALAATPAAAVEPRCAELGSSCVFSDDFENGLSSSLTQWGNGTSDPARMAFVNDKPSTSAGSKSLQLSAGTGGTAYLYKKLSRNYERLYYRYYMKFEGGGSYHHSGGMLGGYEPPTNWPQGDAGQKGVRANGEKFVSIGLEAWGDTGRMDTYNNWIDMQGAAFNGQYYGRNFLQDLNVRVPDQWACIEMMVSLNTPSTATNGEFTVWMNGTEVVAFRPGNPRGYWDGSGNWRMNSTSPEFTGFRWRDTTSLGLNWVKVQSYNAIPKMWVDDLVVATERIGCHGSTPPPASPAPSAPPPPPVLLP